MTRRTQTVSPWIELTLVVREEQMQPEVDYGDGEDDLDVLMRSPPQIVEVTTKVKAKRDYIRYFFGRRDLREGVELHFTNGHIWVVQESFEAVSALLPGFTEVHSNGAPTAILVNPDTVRFFHGHFPPLGSTEAPAGSRVTFPNGNKLEVTESYDELNAKFGMN